MSPVSTPPEAAVRSAERTKASVVKVASGPAVSRITAAVTIFISDDGTSGASAWSLMTGSPLRWTDRHVCGGALGSAATSDTRSRSRASVTGPDSHDGVRRTLSSGVSTTIGGGPASTTQPGSVSASMRRACT